MWLGRLVVDVEIHIADLVPGIQQRRKEDLRRAYERYQEVAGLTP
jgi:hypothetical protein